MAIWMCRAAAARIGRVVVGALLAVFTARSAAPVAAAEVADVQLDGSRWGVRISPATLAVRGRTKGGDALVVSDPRPAPARVDGLVLEPARVRWTWPDGRQEVEVRLDGDALDVRVRASAPGSVTWPVLSPVPGPARGAAATEAVDPAAAGRPAAYVLPMFEGLYVPADDPQWSAFLVGEGPLSTTAGLSMPFWGTAVGRHTLTYVLTNPFNNELTFAAPATIAAATTSAAGPTTGPATAPAATGRLGLSVTHAFPRNNVAAEYGVRVLLGDGSPVTPAKLYRRYLVDAGQFVSLGQKIARTPDAAKLLGAAHVYLWGDGLIARPDLANAKALARRIAEQTTSPEPSVGRRLFGLLTDDGRKLVVSLATKEWVDAFEKGELAAELTRVLKQRDFYDPAAWGGVAVPDGAAALVGPAAAGLPAGEVARLNCELLRAAYPDLLPPASDWGDGWSTTMVRTLAAAGLDRLWLGSPNWDGLGDHPAAVRAAVDAGYLVGPYDSFHSIHRSGQSDTWETAQFDQALYDAGAVQNADGSKRRGFQQKGYLLSPAAARPAVERRVADLMNRFRCNSWFVDCDAFGDVFDDFDPRHPSTEAQDAAERVRRMKWITETYGAVVGSEGGSAYAAGAIHFAHGMVTPGIGWGDPDLMKDKKSPYYLGAYYPGDGPAVFFKQVPMKPAHRRVYADPRFRLPLYETVFHDAVVATHQWGFGSLKFADPAGDRALLELLYGVPPLYHLNRAEWAKRADEIKRHYAAFSPLHRAVGTLPITDFAWLTDDRMVQRTRFGDRVTVTSNFGDAPYRNEGGEVPAHAVVVHGLEGGRTITFDGTAKQVAGPVGR